MTNKSLYLIPSLLGDDARVNGSIPTLNTEIIQSLKSFIVEDIREGRRALRKLGYTGNFEDVAFYELNEHTNNDSKSLTEYIGNNSRLGLLSDAGCPIIADPGSAAIAIARNQGFVIHPLVGPSSILLALMGSGFNGQNFAFHGYLPKEQMARVKKVKELEKEVYQKNQTQLFIETPYRNIALLNDILSACKPATKIGIAVNLTLPDEQILVKENNEMKKQDLSFIAKKPCVFLLYK